ncbi:WXG100-like domain-containing protein [Nocardia canadensis]|uniref:WXG100-like domain-containing protein n=1 Tax=Nocardia canadensis TaxID=3065238 RepID=UPI00292CF202|nr:hypothetical protein [Nocardia canadensis]
MTPTVSRVDVDPKVYYQSAVNCFDAAAALFDSFTYIFSELNGYGMMAGRDEDGRAWAASYDQSARDAVAFYGHTYETLRAYGTALNDIGFKHAQSDANLKGAAQPERPADKASTATFGPYALPASAAGGTPQGLAQTAIDVLDAINCPLPDGNTDTLAKAADAWDRLGRIYQNTNAKDKITIAASLFEGVTSTDAAQVRQDLKTIETSIGELLTACIQISKSCTDYKDSIQELRDEIKGFIESIIEEAAIDVAITVIATCLTGVGGLIAGAKAVESARRWSVKIKNAVSAWRARKALQLKGISDDAAAAMSRAKQNIVDLRDRLRRPDPRQTGGELRRPRNDADFEYEWADSAYDAIRRSDADIDDIARNTEQYGFSRSDIEQIKNHVFREEHLLDSYDAGTMGRFEANPRMAEAWQRLQSGNPHSSDVDLLRHELYESNYMRANGPSYKNAHQATIDAGFRWDPESAARDGLGYQWSN